MREKSPSDGNKFVPDVSAIDITDEKFNEIAEDTLDLVKKFGLGHEEMMPCVIVHVRGIEEDGQLGDAEPWIIGISCNFENTEQKHQTVHEIGKSIRKERKIPVAIFMATEAWMSVAKMEENLDLKVPPSQDPNRKECITIAGRTLMGECKVGIMIPIGRGDGNLMIQDGEITRTNRLETFLLDRIIYGFFDNRESEMKGMLKMVNKGKHNEPSANTND